MINEDNWGHCCYSSGKFRASISLGADINTSNHVKLEYLLNKFHGDEIIFQEKFSTIDEAISKANQNYRFWTFVDLEKKLHDGGCSTCQAHD